MFLKETLLLRGCGGRWAGWNDGVLGGLLIGMLRRLGGKSPGFLMRMNRFKMDQMAAHYQAERGPGHKPALNVPSIPSLSSGGIQVISTNRESKTLNVNVSPGWWPMRSWVV
jgi:hypothetical protein